MDMQNPTKKKKKLLSNSVPIKLIFHQALCSQWIGGCSLFSSFFLFKKSSMVEKNSCGKSHSLSNLCEKRQDVLLVIPSCVKKKNLSKPTLNMLP